MKISEFAKNNGVSIDTVRHYMDLNLIIPEKQGGQYNFDDNCQKSLSEVMDLKSLGFKLQEIKTIFYFKTLANLTNYQEVEYYRTLYINKHKNILDDIQNLTLASEKLDHRIKEMSNYDSKINFTLGLDISALKVLACQKCGAKYNVEDAVISDNQIIHGKLTCSCGQTCVVKNGIVVAGEEYEANTPKYDDNFLSEYIDDTNTLYLDNIYKTIDYYSKKIDEYLLNEKVKLELGSGNGFLLRNILEKLPEDCVYIAVDHNIKRHHFLKGMLERADIKRNVIFLCSDFLNMPIKNNCVDYLFDFKGTSNYSFEHQQFLLEAILKHLRKQSYLIGSYLIFNNFELNSKIETNCRKNFIEKNIKSSIKNIGFETMDEKVFNYLEQGGKYENFFVDGEKIYTYMLTAKLSG